MLRRTDFKRSLGFIHFTHLRRKFRFPDEAGLADELTLFIDRDPDEKHPRPCDTLAVFVVRNHALQYFGVSVLCFDEDPDDTLLRSDDDLLSHPDKVPTYIGDPTDTSIFAQGEEATTMLKTWETCSPRRLASLLNGKDS